MSSIKRLGIYGGTFSPPHNGHIYAAKVFMEKLGLDRLLVIPTCIPPHKHVAENDPEARLEMTDIAFSTLPEYNKTLFVDPYEYRSGGKSYTAKTLEHFSGKDRELFFLCGTDMFLTLADWYHPEIICSLATIVLLRRESDPENVEEIESYSALLCEKFAARIVKIASDAIELSSSEIRERVANGQPIDTLVPAGVVEYIKAKGLYSK